MLSLLPDVQARVRDFVVGRPVVSALLAAAVCVHVMLVISIASQPLHGSSVRQRPWIWSLHNDTVYRAGPAKDFLAVYIAGLWVREGRSPYTRLPRHDVPFGYGFRYLPATAYLLGVPLSTLPPHVAWWLWIAVCELLLAGCIAVFARAAPGAFGAAAALLLLGSSPYFLELYMGQFTFATCALTVLAAVALESHTGLRSRISAAAALVASFVLKVFPLVVLPALWKRRDGAVAGSISVVVLLALAVPGLLADPESWRAFYTANVGAPMGGLNAGNHGLIYLVNLLGSSLGVRWDPSGWNRLAGVWQGVVLVPTAVLVLASRHPSLLLGATTLLLAHFLSYVHVWEHHMSGAVLVVLGAALVFWRRSEREALPWLFGAALLLALPTPFALLDPGLDPHARASWPHWQRLLLPASKALPLLAAFAVCARSLLRSGLAWPGWRPGREA